jgi:integrase
MRPLRLRGTHWTRTREYLTDKEVEKLIATARRSARYGHRDATLILVAFRHGLRASEIADLEWSQVEFGRTPTLHVRRVKNGKPAADPMRRTAGCASYSGNTSSPPMCSPRRGTARSPRTPSIA